MSQARIVFVLLLIILDAEIQISGYMISKMTGEVIGGGKKQKHVLLVPLILRYHENKDTRG